MAKTADIRNGLCIHFNNDIFQILSFQHVKPGKGGAFVRTKLKSLTTGRVLDNTFNGGAKIDTARVERRKFQFLYKDDNGLNFMNQTTFEQISIEEKMIENADLLKDGEEIEILYHAETETPLTCDIPASVVLEVKYTEPGVKGDTATNTLKPAKVETGAEIPVPLFINQGDKIKVNTVTRSYMERVKG